MLKDADAVIVHVLWAHHPLDRAGDRLYSAKGFDSERERVEHLFMLYYEKVRAPLGAVMKAKPKRRRTWR